MRGEQQPRLAEQRPRKRNSLAFASGEQAAALSLLDPAEQCVVRNQELVEQPHACAPSDDATERRVADGDGPAPRARDGRSLDVESAATQAAFQAAYGADAAERWRIEHDIATRTDLARQWSQRTRAEYFGLYPAYTLGTIADRNHTVIRDLSGLTPA